jgi:hypothetical protein
MDDDEKRDPPFAWPSAAMSATLRPDERGVAWWMPEAEAAIAERAIWRARNAAFACAALRRGTRASPP